MLSSHLWYEHCLLTTLMRILMGKGNGKDTLTGLRQPYAGHVQAFLSSAPTFVPPIEPSLHVWSEYPSLHTAPIGLPCPVERWELPQGRAECHPSPNIVHASPVFHINTNPTNCRTNTCKFA